MLKIIVPRQDFADIRQRFAESPSLPPRRYQTNCNIIKYSRIESYRLRKAGSSGDSIPELGDHGCHASANFCSARGGVQTNRERRTEIHSQIGACLQLLDKSKLCPEGHSDLLILSLRLFERCDVKYRPIQVDKAEVQFGRRRSVYP